jgi:teichoic acid transport system ATP-binding protein
MTARAARGREPGQGAASAGATPEAARGPTVIADDLHVVYKVHAPAVRRPGQSRRWLRDRRPRRTQSREIQALRGISFVAYEGDAVGVVGANGAGKTTLLRAIAGLLPPAADQLYTRSQAALLGVNAALLDDLTGSRNITLGCLAMGMTPAEVRGIHDQVAEFSGAGTFIGLPMRAYSTGMAQRLRFAIAAARDQDLLLVDEALATGDAEFRVRSAQRMAELRAQAATVFLVSHSLEAIADSCNRAIWLEAGKVRMAAGAAEVVAAYREDAAS